MTTWIYVNRHTIARNAKHGSDDPPICIRNGKHGKPTHAHEIEFTGPARVVYDARNPILPCGARLAISTDSAVRVLR